MATEISRIDRAIDAVREELLRREKIRNPLDAGAWQKAWDRHPELLQRERDLFKQRGALQQQQQAEREHAAAMRSARTARAKPAKKCPTCGCRTLVAA